MDEREKRIEEEAIDKWWANYWKEYNEKKAKEKTQIDLKEFGVRSNQITSIEKVRYNKKTRWY